MKHVSLEVEWIFGFARRLSLTPNRDFRISMALLVIPGPFCALRVFESFDLSLSRVLEIRRPLESDSFESDSRLAQRDSPFVGVRAHRLSLTDELLC
jgi:hypothetical protein